MDASGWRLFDVAINSKTVLKDLDIWKESGHDGALKKTARTKIAGGQLVISFPGIKSGQALISAIAIASAKSGIKPAPPSGSVVSLTNESDKKIFGLREWMQTGEMQYKDDSNTRYQQLPPHLHGATWIQTSRLVQNLASIELRAGEDVDLFLGIDSSASKPGWFTDHEDTRTWIINSAGKYYRVYRKRYKSGMMISLPVEDLKEMYLIAFTPVSRIEPAYDLKAVASYKAFNARISGPGINKGQVDGKDRVIFAKASGENRLDWDITVGVADTYSLTITYHNPHEKIVKGRLELRAADGTLMKEEEVEFTPTRPGKSNYINSSTGSMINAGNYTVRLSSDEAEQISINALDVQ